MRTLIGLMGCELHARNGVHQAIRETWNTEAGEIGQLRFFVGQGGQELKPDEVRVDAPDDKESLLYKVAEMCRWALGQGYDTLFKVNNSTYVDVGQVLKTRHWELDYAGAVVGRLGERYSGSDAFGFVQGSASWLGRRAMEIVAGDAVSFALHHKDAWMKWNGWISPYMHSEDLWIGQVLTPRLPELRVAVDSGYGNGPLSWWSQSNYVKCYKMEEWMRAMHSAGGAEGRRRVFEDSRNYPKGWNTFPEGWRQ